MTRLTVIVSRGHNEGDYLNQLIAKMTIHSKSEVSLEELLVAWSERALAFKSQDAVRALILVALVAKEMSFEVAAALAAKVLSVAVEYIAKKKAKAAASVGVYAH